MNIQKSENERFTYSGLIRCKLFVVIYMEYDNTHIFSNNIIDNLKDIYSMLELSIFYGVS